MKFFYAGLIVIFNLVCRSNGQTVYCDASATSNLHKRMLEEINKQRSGGNSQPNHKHAVKLAHEYSRIAYEKIDTHWACPDNCYRFFAPIDCDVTSPDTNGCLKKATKQFYPSLTVGDNALGVADWPSEITESNVAAQIAELVRSDAFSFLLGNKPSANPDAWTPLMDYIGLAHLGKRIAIIGVNRNGNSGYTPCHVASGGEATAQQLGLIALTSAAAVYVAQ